MMNFIFFMQRSDILDVHLVSMHSELTIGCACMSYVICYASDRGQNIIQFQNTVFYSQKSAAELFRGLFIKSFVGEGELLFKREGSFGKQIIKGNAIIGFIILMQIQKRKRIAKYNPSLIQIIQQHSEIKDYFEKNCEKNDCVSLAVELIKEGIANRLQKNTTKSKEKHYHVAYIKHNRFLSPSQKQQVTEKVTQIIPVNQKPVKIYAKPKLKIDQNTNVPEKCIEGPISSYQQKNQKEKGEKIYLKESKEQQENKRQQSQKYLSPKGRQKYHQQTKGERNKQKQKSNQKQIIQQYYSPKHKQAVSNTNKQSNYQSNSKSTLKENNKLDIPILSPRIKQNYDKVQSRIKFLIDRDKQSKKVQKILQKQSKKIQKLQQRQQRLLLLQYQQQRQIFRNNQINRFINQMSSSSDSQSIPNNPTHKQLNTISQQLDVINQRAENIRDSHSQLYSNLQKMKDKTYKIGSNPVYPISSSSDQQEG